MVGVVGRIVGRIVGTKKQIIYLFFKLLVKGEGVVGRIVGSIVARGSC